jgi:hypothetical protein
METRTKQQNVRKVKNSILDSYKIQSVHHYAGDYLHVIVSTRITGDELEAIHQSIKELGYKQFEIAYGYEGNYKKLWTENGRLRPNCLAGDKDGST